jgi:hypothetical protein
VVAVEHGDEISRLHSGLLGWRVRLQLLHNDARPACFLRGQVANRHADRRRFRCRANHDWLPGRQQRRSQHRDTSEGREEDEERKRSHVFHMNASVYQTLTGAKRLPVDVAPGGRPGWVDV